MDLLARQAATQCVIDEGQARQWLSVIIPWWKQKNKFSRGLTSSEKAAYRQILNEVRLRLEIRANPADAQTAARIAAASPDWLVIAKDSGYTVTCLRRVPGIFGLVIRETWGPDGQDLKATADSFMPGSETGRWELLASRQEWAEWPKHGRRLEFLSEPEYRQLLAEVREIIVIHEEGHWKTFVAVTASQHALYAHGVRARDYYWNSRGEPEWTLKQAKWERVKGAVRLQPWAHWTTLSADLCLDPADKNPNQVSQDGRTPDYEESRLANLTPDLRQLPFTVHGHRLLWFDEAALGESRKILLKEATKQRRKNRRWATVRFYQEHIEAVLKARFWEHEKQKYLADGGLTELWEDHRKTVKFHRLELDKTDLESCLSFLVNAGIKLTGRQSGEMWTLAAEKGWKAGNPEANGSIPANIPLPEPTEE